MPGDTWESKFSGGAVKGRDSVVDFRLFSPEVTGIHTPDDEINSFMVLKRRRRRRPAGEATRLSFSPVIDFTCPIYYLTLNRVLRAVVAVVPWAFPPFLVPPPHYRVGFFWEPVQFSKDPWNVIRRDRTINITRVTCLLSRTSASLPCVTHQTSKNAGEKNGNFVGEGPARGGGAKGVFFGRTGVRALQHNNLISQTY